MPENDPADRDRRSFIGDTLRLTAFCALIATGAVLGLRKNSSGSRIYRCSNSTPLPCRECGRYSRCDVPLTDPGRKHKRSVPPEVWPGQEGETSAKK